MRKTGVYLAPKGVDPPDALLAWWRSKLPEGVDLITSSEAWKRENTDYSRFATRAARKYAFFVVHHDKGRVGRGTGMVLQEALRRNKRVYAKKGKKAVKVTTIDHDPSADWTCNWRIHHR